jgi:hypothetical protein
MRLGCDPEVFLCNAAGKHISVIGLIQADKWNPLQIKGMAKGFTLQEDNVSLEYGIPPAATEDEFVHHIQAVMEKSKEWIGDLKFSNLSCTIFEKDQMQHPLAHVFGCEPDFDAWTQKENNKPKPPHEYMRAAGGHIHVETNKNPFYVAQMMDLYLGIPSIIMDEKGGQRRQTGYGRKGACRPKPYGVEYRALSNFWIFDEKTIRWAWKATEKALKSSVELSEDLEFWVNEAINNNDKNVAEALVKEFDLYVVHS